MARTATKGNRRPKLGQNFLTDRSAAGRIVDALGDVSESTVVEVGPGRGVLTGLLVGRAQHVIAIELDRVLGAQLRMKYAHQSGIEILEGDVLDIDFESLLRRPHVAGDANHPFTGPARVVGNLPYYITSPILQHLLAFPDLFSTMVILVQREVADRIAAKPGGREYGLLSATVQLYARIEKLFTLPPGAFSPPPKVHSTVLRLTIEPQEQALGVRGNEFLDFLKLSFGQKRKTLANNLKLHYPGAEIKAALAKAGVKFDARAEALPLAKAAAVFKALTTSGHRVIGSSGDLKR
ncbi:MAG: 16S rRNA (adenine(1518)-N(6)/adenine(1519)-N(6))-dimethyltransferase RsmA [Terriglobales bacterium]